jgi:hypothetical protein
MASDRSETNRSAPDPEEKKRAGADSVWYTLLLGPPFKVIGFFYRNYRSNRQKLAEFSSGPRVSSLIRYALVLTLFLWIVIWLLASEQSRNRLTDAIKQQFHTLRND